MPHAQFDLSVMDRCCVIGAYSTGHAKAIPIGKQPTTLGKITCFAFSFRECREGIIFYQAEVEVGRILFHCGLKLSVWHGGKTTKNIITLTFVNSITCICTQIYYLHTIYL